MAAIVGLAGLAPTLAAVRRGRHGGAGQQGMPGLRRRPVRCDEVRRRGAMLLPVDSEHNAIFQVLEPAATAVPSTG